MRLLSWNMFPVISWTPSRTLSYDIFQYLLLQEENEAEEEVLDGMASVLAVALRKWGDAAMPFVEALMPAIGQVCGAQR